MAHCAKPTEYEGKSGKVYRNPCQRDEGHDGMCLPSYLGVIVALERIALRNEKETR